jgi:hypothetical protein
MCSNNRNDVHLLLADDSSGRSSSVPLLGFIFIRFILEDLPDELKAKSKEFFLTVMVNFSFLHTDYSKIQ